MANNRAYFKIATIPLKLFLIHRTDFLLNASMYVIPLYAKYFLFKTVYQGGASLGNYDLRQILTYYLISRIFYENMPFYANYDTINHIKNGGLSLFLTKPLSYETYSFAITVGNKTSSIFTTILALLLYLPLVSRYLYIPPLKNILMFLLSSLVGFFIAYYMGMLFNYSSFFLGDAERGYSFYNILIWALGGELLPLDILPGGHILSYSPFALSMYVPVHLITSSPNNNYFLSHLAGGILWIFLLHLILRIIYAKGLKRYEAYGG